MYALSSQVLIDELRPILSRLPLEKRLTLIARLNEVILEASDAQSVGK